MVNPPVVKSDFEKLIDSISGAAESIAGTVVTVRDTLQPADPSTTHSSVGKSSGKPSGGIFTGTSALGIPNAVLWPLVAVLGFKLIKGRL